MLLDQLKKEQQEDTGKKGKYINWGSLKRPSWWPTGIPVGYPNLLTPEDLEKVFKGYFRVHTPATATTAKTKTTKTTKTTTTATKTKRQTVEEKRSIVYKGLRDEQDVGYYKGNDKLTCFNISDLV